MKQNNLTTQAPQSVYFFKPMLIGAGIALLVILFFVTGVDNPKLEWGQYWMVRPLIIAPVAGAIGGAFYAYMLFQSSRGFNRTIAILLSLAVFVIGIFLGVVLGLDGTMWD